MLQWLDQHTQYLPVQLFIGGDSYSGIIVPLVTKKVLEGKTLSWQLYITLNFYIEIETSSKSG